LGDLRRLDQTVGRAQIFDGALIFTWLAALSHLLARASTRILVRISAAHHLLRVFGRDRRWTTRNLLSLLRHPPRSGATYDLVPVRMGAAIDFRWRAVAAWRRRAHPVAAAVARRAMGIASTPIAPIDFTASARAIATPARPASPTASAAIPSAA